MVKPRANVRSIQKYKPTMECRSKGDYLLLDANERTTPNKAVQKSIIKFLKKTRLNLYPEYINLNEPVAEYAGVEPKNILLTNGSDQAIDLIIRTFVNPGEEIIIADPTFVMFAQYSKAHGAKLKRIKYNKDMSFPTDKLLSEIKKTTKLVMVANPNNPTGTLVDRDDIIKILKKNCAVLIDEAYFEFADTSCIDLIGRYPNLIVTRTFSKAFGLAGLRIGYIVSKQSNLTEIRKVKSPYDVNMVAVAAVKSAMKNISAMRKYVREAMKKSKPMLEKFLKKKQVKFFPSRANFVLIEVEDAQNLAEFLKKSKVLARPQGKNLLRITVGTAGQTRKLIKVLNKYNF
jgi:histidinol-phosphate aminotransferase